MKLTRRELLGALPSAGIMAMCPAGAFAAENMPTRDIPGTGERLPIIGLGSSKPVAQIAERGTAPIAGVLRTLVENGGSVVDTWPRNPANDAAFGEVLNLPGLRESLFVTSKIDRTGREEGIRQFHQTLSLYGREALDLLQVFSLTDVATQWSNLRDFKEQGKVRYIGVTVSTAELYEPLLRFLEREQPDFVQVNYSITEREAETRILPLLRDRGIAAIINRPFMNGDYFRKLGDRPLPAFAREFDCESWAQFSLKYILPNPAVTCVLTETSNPAHMAENAGAAFGRMPDDRQRARMREFIETV